MKRGFESHRIESNVLVVGARSARITRSGGFGFSVQNKTKQKGLCSDNNCPSELAVIFRALNSVPVLQMKVFAFSADHSKTFQILTGSGVVEGSRMKMEGFCTGDPSNRTREYEFTSLRVVSTSTCIL